MVTVEQPLLQEQESLRAHEKSDGIPLMELPEHVPVKEHDNTDHDVSNQENTQKSDGIPLVELPEHVSVKEHDNTDHDESNKGNTHKHRSIRKLITNTAMHFVAPERVVESYINEYNCLPPPIFIPLITLAEIAVTVYYAVTLADHSTPYTWISGVPLSEISRLLHAVEPNACNVLHPIGLR
jgi:hypothetical protein